MFGVQIVLAFDFRQSKVPARFGKPQAALGVWGATRGHAPLGLESAETAFRGVVRQVPYYTRRHRERACRCEEIDLGPEAAPTAVKDRIRLFSVS